MDPINTEVVSQTGHNLKLLGYVVIVALLAFASFAFLNRDSIDYGSELNQTGTLSQSKSLVAKKPLVQFKLFHDYDQREKMILERVNDPAPLTKAEKDVIINQFSIKNSKNNDLTEEERQKINKALSQ